MILIFYEKMFGAFGLITLNKWNTLKNAMHAVRRLRDGP